MKMNQNPHACGDNHCVLLLPHIPRGQGTNGGCRCLPAHMDAETRMRVRKGIRWLAHRLGMCETLLDRGYDIVNTHLEAGYGQWLDAVGDYAISDE